MPSIEYIEKITASASIAHITDGADSMPCKSVKCSVIPSGGGGTPSTPVPIVGASSVTVSQRGKNLIPSTNYMTSYFSVANNGVVSQITTGAPFAWAYANSIFKTTLPAGTYTAIEELLTNSTNASHGVQVFNSSNNMIARVSSGAKTAGTYSATFTLSEKTDIGIVCKLYDGTAKLYIISGESESAYEPFNAIADVTAQIGQTVYGGEYDFNTGVFTATHAYHKLVANSGIFLDSGKNGFRIPTVNWQEGEMIFQSDSDGLCNIMPTVTESTSFGVRFGIKNSQIYLVQCFSEFGSTVEAFQTYLNNHDMYFCYKLATPIEITGLDTHIFNTVLGVNNFYCDTGDTQVTYYAQAEAQEAYSIEGETLTDIADAIREKTGGNTPIDVSDFADEISGIDTVQMVQYDSLTFDGDLYIELPNNLVSPNHSYFIDFTTETQADATGEHTIFGIKNEYHSNFVGIRYNSLRYQVGQNGGSTNISNSWDELTGRHTFLYDGSGTVYFDTDAHTYTYNPSNTNGDNIPLVIGSATATPRTGKTWKGKVHRFTIRNTSTNTLVADYVPCAMQRGNTVVIAGLLDLVSGNLITAPSCGVANEEVSNG